ncbi:MAG: ATP-binding cassette domain-containing protein [Alphaproteobacteria bacterium]
MTLPPLLSIDVPLLMRGGRPLVKDFSLRVYAGDTVHITGPNGVGKSSLLRAMVGLLPFQGPRPVRTPSVFFLPTDKDYLDGQTGKAYLALWKSFETQVLGSTLGGYGGFSPVKPEDQNDLFLPKQSLTLPMGRLSSGMQQRVRLSRLMQTQSQLWILDEPWQALDHDAAGVLDDCITRHQARGGAVIWTSHTLRAFPFAHRTLDLSTFVPAADTEDPWPF